MLGFAELEESSPERLPEWVEIPHKKYDVPPEWESFKAERELLTEELVTTSREILEINSQIMKLYDQTATLRSMHDRLIGSAVHEKMDELITEFELECGLTQLVDQFAEKAGKVDALREILKTERKGSACPICMEDDVSTYLDPCGHTFCSTCVNKCKNANSCPVCRGPVRERRGLFFN